MTADLTSLISHFSSLLSPALSFFLTSVSGQLPSVSLSLISLVSDWLGGTYVHFKESNSSITVQQERRTNSVPQMKTVKGKKLEDGDVEEGCFRDVMELQHHPHKFTQAASRTTWISSHKYPRTMMDGETYGCSQHTLSYLNMYVCTFSQNNNLQVISLQTVDKVYFCPRGQTGYC